MSDSPASSDAPRELGQYEIRLKGRLEPRWAAWFDGLNLTQESDGTTVIRGSVIDQAALHGLLTKVRDLGLPLIAVTQVDPKQMNRAVGAGHVRIPVGACDRRTATSHNVECGGT